MPDDPLDSGKPREGLARSLRAALIWTPIGLPAVGLQFVVWDATDSYWLGYLAGSVLPVVVTPWLAPRVSYRRRDILITVIAWPHMAGRIASRMALLPYRDWTPRTDEVRRSRWHHNPRYAGYWWISRNPSPWPLKR
ncbi:hypothetical protein [Micromonospora sp. NPDC049679]|uniref:hypothetical protein n=1 Tax=Micromonospora sp. NPDC049679 TaxID=3155920 RepID=UPI00340B47C7